LRLIDDLDELPLAERTFRRFCVQIDVIENLSRLGHVELEALAEMDSHCLGGFKRRRIELIDPIAYADDRAANTDRLRLKPGKDPFRAAIAQDDEEVTTRRNANIVHDVDVARDIVPRNLFH